MKNTFKIVALSLALGIAAAAGAASAETVKVGLPPNPIRPLPRRMLRATGKAGKWTSKKRSAPRRT